MKKIGFLSIVFLTGLFNQLFSYEISAVSMFRNTAPYIKEWIEYHHMIGVEHFYLYNDASTDNWEEVLKPYIDQGIVEVFYWPADKPDWVTGQINAFKDGITRSIGKTKWLAIMDQDEYILPLKDRSLTECLNKHFSEATAVYMNWRNFGTNNVTLAPGEPLLFRLTGCTLQTHSRNTIGKSIVRPEHIDLEWVWSPHHVPLLSGKYFNGDAEVMPKGGGIDLHTDGKNHDGYLRVNHYSHFDENYFHNVRVQRSRNIGVEEFLIWEHYKSFNSVQDYTILIFIESNYPDKYEEIWKKHS